MFTLFRWYSNYIYKFTISRDYDARTNGDMSLGQQVLFWMIIVHYWKEVFEAFTVVNTDKHHNRTMGHNVLAYKLAIHWAWVGFGVAFYAFHPFYTAPSWLSFDEPHALWLLVAVFAVTELMSLLSNIHLTTI